MVLLKATDVAVQGQEHLQQPVVVANTATASRTVTWTADVTAPTITATGGYINSWL